MASAPSRDAQDSQTPDLPAGDAIGGKGDRLLAGILIAFSLGVVALSLQMPRPSGWLSAPGLFPIFAAVVLLGLSLGLLVSGVRRAERVPAAAHPAARAEQALFAKRAAIVAAGVLLYVFLLIPLLHFRAATFVYLVGTLWYFWRGAWHKVVLISLAATLFLSEMFTWFFQILLP
jgi:hypothetical protein